MKVIKYPLYNSENELIGNCTIDRVYDGGLGPDDPVVLCEDLQGRSYEIGAHSVSRIINFSDPNMPRTYARTT